MELADHPDRTFVTYIPSGIQEGFCHSQSLQAMGRNMQCLDPSLVSNYLTCEVQLGRMWQLPPGVFPRGVHMSPLGLIPKKNRPGQWRLILDLSSPQGVSINNGISKELSSLAYCSIDLLSAHMVKSDIKEAYCMVLIQPEDQHLLRVKWQESIFIDRILPFGLRSAPKIRTEVADAIQWILARQGVSKSLYYLDDFVLVAHSWSSVECQK